MELSRSDWAEHLADWRRSGETATRYCDEHGLKLGSLRYWSGRIRREASEALDETFAGAPVAMARTGFAKVVRTGSPTVAASEPRGTAFVVRVGEVEVEVPPDFDAATLRRLLEVLVSPGGAR